MFHHSRLAIFILLVVMAASLAACSSGQAVLPADQAQPESPPTGAPAATEIPPTSTRPAPTSTPQPTRTPGRADIVYPVPKALAGQAPWLMFPCAETETGSLPMLASSDGSGCLPISVPAGIPGRSWIAAASQRGSYVAVRVKISKGDQPNAAYQLQQNALDDQLLIVKLPENRIIRKIPQITREGWEKIAKMWQEPGSDGKNFVPLPLAVILDPGAYRWSPNGRYLAYTAIDGEGADLFVYDTLHDSILRMSKGRKGAFFWDWSPKGKWILYRDMASCKLVEGRCQMERGMHYYAVTFPDPEYQFEDSFPVSNVDWVSETSYILQDIPAQGQLSTRLQQVDLLTGIVTTLYDQPFYSYTYVPKTYVSRKQMYLLHLPADAAKDRVAGTYTLYPPRQVDWLRPFLTGKYGEYTLQWERTLETFILSRNVSQDVSVGLTGEPLIQKDVILIPVTLVEPVPLGVLGTANLSLSPDGAWFTSRLSSGAWVLFTKEGQQILEIGASAPGSPNPVQWLKDSSGFIFFGSRKGCASSDGCVYRFARDKAWEAVKIGELKNGDGAPQVIEP